MGFRDQIFGALIVSAVEAYGLLHFTNYKPTGGLGRLTEWCLIANVVLLYIYNVWLYPAFFSPLRHLPRPKSNPFWGNMRGRAKGKAPADGLRVLVNEVENDGLIYWSGLLGQEMLIATSHESLKAVLSDRPYDYIKPAVFVNILRRILGDGLILVEGSVHKFQRKHLMPSFQLRQIKDLYPTFWAKSCELAVRLPDESEVKPDGTFEIEFSDWCMRATLDIIGIAGFGKDFNSLRDKDHKVAENFHLILDPSGEKLLWFGLNLVFPPKLVNAVPWRINRMVNGVQTYLNSFALDLVRERRREIAAEKSSGADAAGDAPHRADILSLLVKSNDFSDQELVQQVLTMVAAGHETTSSALAWCAYLLALNPEVQAKVRDEVRAALPSPSSGKSIAAPEIDNLTWLNAVCLEVVRLYPTVPVTIREAINDTEIQGIRVPKGTRVLLAPWAINRSEHFWGKSAQEFTPERWINDDGSVNKNGGSSSNYAQLTFLHGPRSCIGQGFAQSELKNLLAAFIGRYEIEVRKDGTEYYPAGIITTKPAQGMWLKCKEVPGW